MPSLGFGLLKLLSDYRSNSPDRPPWWGQRSGSRNRNLLQLRTEEVLARLNQPLSAGKPLSQKQGAPRLAETRVTVDAFFASGKAPLAANSIKAQLNRHLAEAGALATSMRLSGDENALLVTLADGRTLVADTQTRDGLSTLSVRVGDDRSNYVYTLTRERLSDGKTDRLTASLRASTEGFLGRQPALNTTTTWNTPTSDLPPATAPRKQNGRLVDEIA